MLAAKGHDKWYSIFSIENVFLFHIREIQEFGNFSANQNEEFNFYSNIFRFQAVL